MRYLIGILALLCVGYFVWPYAYLYRIDQALLEGDNNALKSLVHLESVRSEFKQGVQRDVSAALGDDDESEGVLDWLRDKVNDLGERAIEEVIDIAWVNKILNAEGRFKSRITYAFFESWNQFIIRLGDLGEDPVHVRMSLIEGNWRITAVFP